VEIGSNNGTFLKAMQERGFDVLGIDPAKEIAEKACARGIPTLPRFFDADLAREVRIKYGPANFIVSSNTVANLDNMGDFMQGIKEMSQPNTVVVIETQYGLDVLKKNLLDVIYHEHLSYFTVQPLVTFFDAHGFKVIDVEHISPKGGSIRIAAAPSESDCKISNNVSRFIKRESDAGLSEVDRATTPVATKVKKRLPWMLLNLFNSSDNDVIESGCKVLPGNGSEAPHGELFGQFGRIKFCIRFLQVVL